MINRSNYSDYFMLYADGELDALQMQIVEAFVAENNDLSAEFDLYLETKITPDEHISMPDKSMLLKPEIWDTENLTEEQSALLSFADSEGSKPHTTNLNIEAEWSLLQKTLLPAEVVAMPHKEKLYRKESQRKPIFILYAKRIAVAAAFLLAGMFLVEKMTTNETISTPESIASVTETPEKPKETPVTTNVPATNTNADKDPEITPVNNVPGKTVPVLAQNTATDHQQKPAELSTGTTNAGKKTEYQDNIVNPDHNDAITNVASMRQSNESVIQVKNQAPTQNILQLKTNAVDTKEIELKVNPANTYTANVVTEVKDEAAVAEDEAEYIYIVGSKVKKQKFRGIARTINRGIDKIVNPTKRQANVNE
ncbi:anti-sigma factor [Polluticaenibacter yanchengensis]|uniref:Uncharacterized protein n=1 Tax=Polluticaenibacter yanchengensis TaxID=3014562 RepID=A0ABT4UJQ8_9BACT|nr:hypothetical protein [Chitinophagaceae bacterium LY-5]